MKENFQNNLLRKKSLLGSEKLERGTRNKGRFFLQKTLQLLSPLSHLGLRQHFNKINSRHKSGTPWSLDGKS